MGSLGVETGLAVDVPGLRIYWRREDRGLVVVDVSPTRLPPGEVPVSVRGVRHPPQTVQNTPVACRPATLVGQRTRTHKYVHTHEHIHTYIHTHV